MKALITAELTDDGVEQLRGAGYDVQLAGWGHDGHVMPAELLRIAAGEADVLVCELEEVDEALLQDAPRLKVVAACRANPVNVDVAAATRHGVVVVNTPGRNAASVADFTVGLLLCLARHITASERHLRDSGWHVDGQLPYLHFRGPELAGKTLGVVGFGATGREVARRALRGFDMRVLACDPYADIDVPGVEAAGLEKLLRESTFVSLHCAMTPETTGMIGRDELRLIGPDGYLVNSARAAVVDEAALLDALRDGHIGGAALDVYWKEPLPPGHPLFDAPNVVLTPHLAGAADDVRTHQTAMVLDDLARWRHDRPPLRLVNPEAWETRRR